MAWEEYYVYNTTFTNLTGGTGTTFTENEIRIDTDADFKFMKTIHQPVTARARIQYRDNTNGRFLMKGSQDIRTISGHALYNIAPGTPLPPGFTPFIWPRPYIIPAATTFTIGAADFSGLTATLRMAFHGTKVRAGTAPWDRKYRAMIPYVYPLSTTGTIDIPANGTTTASIPTDNDSHFVVYKLVGARDGACTLTMKDGARDRQWMNEAIHFDNLIGNGSFPNILPAPRFIPRGTVVSISLTDLSGSTNTVEINLVGVKLYEE